MNLKSAILTTAFLAFGVSSVQAANIHTPDILSSVPSGLVQTLTKAESAETRGEYRFCRWGGSCTIWRASFGIPPRSMPGYDYRQAVYVGPFWVSR